MSDPIGWAALAAAASVWGGILLGTVPGVSWLLLPLGLLAVTGRSAVRLVVVCVTVGLLVGLSQQADDRTVRTALEDDPGGQVTLVGELRSDGRPRPPPGRGWYARFHPTERDGHVWQGPPLLLTTDEGEPPSLGSVVEVRGVLRPSPVVMLGRPLAGVVDGGVVVRRGPGGLLGSAEWIRERVRRTIDAGANAPAGGLLIGFLLGDTTSLDPLVERDLRDAGLAHYVAVSGSNVALFLAGWWVLTLPLATRPRLRWLTGILGLGLFAAVTRWEPSVVRASAVAGLALASRRFGIVLSARGLLGVAVSGCLLVLPAFATSLGFQLSVAATLGLVLGASGSGRGPVRALRATLAAQVAVAPLLLARFGEVPLASPLANLLAGPAVSAATVGAMAAAVMGAGWSMWPAARLADLVILIGGVAAPLPKVGWWGFGVAVVLLLAARRRSLRRPVVAIAVVGAIAVVVWPGPIRGPAVVFLDVGQGDAALVIGEEGEVVLVDGGPDPDLLVDALHRYRIRAVDLLVVSHRHADHVTGLAAVVGRLPIGRVWHPEHRELRALGPVLAAIDAAGVERATPSPGTRAMVGGIALDVVGPVRRYASPNDESLVLEVGLDGLTVLFAGDIETFAQADLGPRRADVLKVPHQGAATSDRDWLEGSAGALSVVSVGPNDFGHPADWVIETLEQAGSLVCRTDVHGDVIVRPGRLSC